MKVSKEDLRINRVANGTPGMDSLSRLPPCSRKVRLHLSYVAVSDGPLEKAVSNRFAASHGPYPTCGSIVYHPLCAPDRNMAANRCILRLPIDVSIPLDMLSDEV